MGNKLHLSNFIIRLKALRNDKDWTQQNLADVMEVDLKTVRNWENAKLTPPACNGMKLTHFINLCEKLECDPEYLIGDLQTKRKATSDIVLETGLSKEAAESLAQIKEEGHTVIGSAKIMLLNAMLEDVLFLENAANVLYALHMIPEESFVNISFHDKNWTPKGNALITNRSDDLRRLYMADLQNIIFSFLRRQFQK